MLRRTHVHEKHDPHPGLVFSSKTRQPSSPGVPRPAAMERAAHFLGWGPAELTVASRLRGRKVTTVFSGCQVTSAVGAQHPAPSWPVWHLYVGRVRVQGEGVGPPVAEAPGPMAARLHCALPEAQWLVV